MIDTGVRGVDPKGLIPIDDVSVGAWIAPRLGGEFGAVTLQVPTGYEAYARICHAATDESGRPASWPQVAAQTGRTAHAVMQWHAIVGSSDPDNFTGSLWPGEPPVRGDLGPVALEKLLGILAHHTATVNECYFALWEGYGWIDGNIRMTFYRAGTGREGTVERDPPAFSAQELGRPRLQLPGRGYLMFAGPLSAAKKLGNPNGLEGFDPHSPNLFWPADHAWCVASEIDFDSTLVGGTERLVAAIIDDPDLDSWRVQATDSLACDADEINTQ